jgi:hypothetical protein
MVSKLETAESLDDSQVLTVRRYLQALGDDLELVATSTLGHRIGIAPPARRLTKEEARAEWRRKNVRTLTPEEQLAPERLWMKIVQNALLLREVSKSPVAKEALFFIEICASKLAGQKSVPTVTDEALRRAQLVALRSEPGKSSAAVKYRVVGDHVKAVLDFVILGEDGEDYVPRWLASSLGNVIDPKFRKLREDRIKSILDGYRSTKSKQGLTDAVTALCIESKACGTSPLVDADGSQGAKARKKLRDAVSKALWRK